MLVAERLEELIAARRSQLRGAEMASLRRGGPSIRPFLDLGCGTGTLLLALRALHPGWRLCGVDVSPGMLAVAGGKPGHESVLWARARLPAPLPFTERFDVVGAFYDTLNHLPDQRGAGGDVSDRRLRAASGGPARVRSEQRVRVRDLVAVPGGARCRGAPPRHRARLRRPSSDRARDDRISTSGGRERRFVLQERCFSEPEVEGALRRRRPGPGDRGPLEPGQPGQPKQNVVCGGK